MGYPFGGFRPGRVLTWLASKAFVPPTSETDHYKIRTSYGGVIVGHHFYHIDRQVIIRGCYDAPLHKLLDRLLQPGMVAFDIGANMGEVALHMGLKVKPHGRVYAFEPAPTQITRLRTNISANKLEGVIQSFPIALSNLNGKAKFAYADVLKENQGMGSLVNRANEVVTLETEVETRTLDDFVSSSECIDRIDLIKIDIEGAEVQFMEGGQNTLKTLRPDIIMELSDSDVSQSGSGQTKFDQIRMLEEIGYRIYAIDHRSVSKRVIASDNLRDTAPCLNIYCTNKVKV